MSGTYEAFFAAIRQRESSNDYGIVNGPGFVGAYQFGEAALIDLGFVNPDGHNFDNDINGGWTGKLGINGTAEFLANHSAQDQAAAEWWPLLWSRIRGLDLEFYDQQTLNGVRLTKSGMVAAAHLVGTGALRTFINSGGTTIIRDGNGTAITDYLTLFADYDLPSSFVNHLERDNTIKGGRGNDVLKGFDGNDTIIGGGGTDTIDGGAGNDHIIAGGQGTQIWTGSGADIVEVGAGVTVKDPSKEDRINYLGVRLTGGVQAWWNESGVAANAPFTNLAYAFPSIGAELLAVGAIYADAPSMKFAMYRQEAETGDVIVQFGYGLGGQARIKNYSLDLATGQGIAGLTLFRQGGGGRTASVDQGTGNYVNLALYAGFGHGLPGFDPLVLDLDGDGFEVTAREYSQVYFDFEANGFAKQTGWVGGDDAFLTRDLNMNGLIDDGSELFGNRGQSGFAALGTLDSNADGVIDAGDAGFASLRIWSDLNQDGVSQANELQTLSQAGISSLSLTAVNSPSGTEIRNNIVARTAQFTRSDGTTGSVGDITFDVSDLNTRWRWLARRVRRDRRSINPERSKSPKKFRRAGKIRE